MNITTKLHWIKKKLPKQTRLLIISKFQNVDTILKVYHLGQRLFGESKVQELYNKYQSLPKDIEWHFIGHLQSNKVKYIASFIEMIHSVDSFSILEEINKYATKYQRKIKVLLQIHIAQENHKFGFSFKEVDFFFQNKEWKKFEKIEIVGFMGVATLTTDEKRISQEFEKISKFFSIIKKKYLVNQESFKELSIGMSNDYHLALTYGSTIVRIGSYIFE